METLYALSHIGYTIPPQADAARRTFYTDGARPGWNAASRPECSGYPVLGSAGRAHHGRGGPVGLASPSGPHLSKDEKRA